MRASRLLRGGGDKSSFAAKRRVLHPIHQSPAMPQQAIKFGYTNDPMKESTKIVFGGVPAEDSYRLEGEKSRKAVMTSKDKEFLALVEFLSGASAEKMISARRFEEAYDAMSEKDETIIWLCHSTMAILNPGDLRSRLIYRHLTALVEAVHAGEMTQRTAFRFYEAAVRSPAFREIAKRQLERGGSTRLAGLVAAAEIAREQGISRRPMTPYFELFQRITERSEALAPWGFPPLFQFEERMQLEPRLRFFARPLPQADKRKRGTGHVISPKRMFWFPPNWFMQRKYAGPWFPQHAGVVPD